MSDETFKPRLHLTPELEKWLHSSLREELSERRAADLAKERLLERQRETRQLVIMFVVIIVLAWLAAMLWRHIFFQINADYRHEVDVAAAQWLDTSDARQCYDYQGMKGGRMVMGCKDGKSYEVMPDVVERAQQMREEGR